jgi:hypothetical protein
MGVYEARENAFASEIDVGFFYRRYCILPLVYFCDEASIGIDDDGSVFDKLLAL